MKNYLISGLVGAILGGAGAYSIMKEKTEVKKTEFKESEKTQKNIVTVIKEITRPDGTKELVSTTTDNSVENKDVKASTITSKPTEKQWLLGLGANPLAYYETYSVKVDRRVMGPFFVGGQYIRNKSDNVGLINVTMEF